MKNLIMNILTISAMVFALFSCEDDASLTTLEEVTFSQPINATPNAIVLSTENSFDNVINVSWDNVMFPIEAPVNYTLQIDVISDTFGENGWANAVAIVAGEDVLSKSILGGELNDIAANIGLQPDIEGELVVRVAAYMDRFVYSEPVSVQVTPYVEEIPFGELYMPGSYNGWDPSTASRLSAIATGVFQGYISISSPTGLGFKITPEQDWDEFYGLDTNGNFALGGDTDLTLPDYGSYQITVNLNNLTYTIIPFSWGIIGPSTAGG